MKICLFDSGIGVIPFIKSIIKRKKNNEYYIILDQEHFPYGNKSDEELLTILKYNLNKIEKLNIDLLLICCNTISYIYLKYKPSTTFVVKTILQINLKKEKPLLATPFLSSKINGISGNNLAYLIENNQIKEIILLLKNIKQNEFVLGCTHYLIIKSLFDQYQFVTYALVDELIDQIERESNKMIFYSNKKSLLKKFFFNIRISDQKY